MLADAITRSFGSNTVLPSAAIDFAISVTLAQLGPEDWQVSEDVGAACARLLSNFHSADSALADPLTVTVGVTVGGVVVTVANAAGSSESEIVEPRRPFTSLQG